MTVDFVTLDTKLRNILVIDASVGGVEALRALFARLPSDLPAAVLVGCRPSLASMRRRAHAGR